MPPISRAILPLALVGALVAASPASGAGGPRAIAAAPSAQRLDLVIPLVADDAGLRALAQAVSTPGSAVYGRYEPVPLLAERFGATPIVQRRALRFLRSAGATGVSINGTRMFADATMTVGRAERTFGVTLARYADTGGNPSFIAPAPSANASRAQPALPAGLVGVATGVIGLDTRRLAPSLAPPRASPGAFARGVSAAAVHPRARAARTASGYLPVSGTQAGCPAARGADSGFTPNQYTTAYGIAPLRAAGLSGRGERIALIEVDGYRYSDIKAFAACFGLDIPALNTYSLGSRHLLAPGGESTLDLEITDAVAPDLKAIDVYENTGNAAAVTRSVVLPLLSPGAKPEVISASLGRCEPELELAFNRATLTSIERDVELAAATGITLVVAAGDTGSSDCTTSRGGVIAQQAVAYPASSPFVTAVGGTNLLLDAGNAISAQLVWNDTPIDLAGGGGGTSELFARPSYQNGVVHGSRRALPDVALLADEAPGYEIYCNPSGNSDCSSTNTPWQTVGGTSAAAPLLAAGTAVVDQDLVRRGRVPLGFLNPLLYRIGRSRLASAVFSDVTIGDNDLGAGGGHSIGCCTAKAGFDEASGWGGVNLSGLDSVARATLPLLGGLSVSIPRGQRPVRRRGLRVRLGCSRRCSVMAFGIVTLGDGTALTVHSSSRTLHHGGSVTPFAGFSRDDLRDLRSALAHHRRVYAELYAVGLDHHGNTTEVTSAVVTRITG